MFIYLIVNHITGKYYVGQHKGDNLKLYFQKKFSKARHVHGSSHLFNSMRKHPLPCDWSIHALLSDVQTHAELNQYERDFIAFLRSQDPEYGYNVCRGGEGFTGHHSSKTRKKIQTTLLGRKHTPDAIARMKATPRTEKQLANLNRNGLRFMTDGTREKLKDRPQNSQFGTCWIQLNGVEKKIKMAELNQHLQQGWVRGRTRPAKFMNKRFVTLTPDESSIKSI